MKKLFKNGFFLSLLFLPLLLSAQDVQNIRGKYIGTVEENGKIHTYYLYFSSQGYAYYCNSNWEKQTFDEKRTTSVGQITNLQWINKGGIWTETQLFSIVKLSSTVLRVVHIRHVVNKGTENKSWYYSGEGTFVKVS